MKDGKFITINISDIHFGAKDSTMLINELNGSFMKLVRGMIPNGLDMVVINGDLIHKKLNFNNKTASELILFIDMLVDLCKKNQIYLRLIQGTYSHDMNQLRNFEFLTDDEYFRIIYEVESEEIKGHNFLYVPEEYMKDQHDYYKTHFEGMYDMIFIHGTFKFVAFKSQEIMSEKPISTAPIFDEKQMIGICNGPIICGHIHIRQNYKNKIFYGGSFTRTSFGEEDAKGFLMIAYDQSDSSYEVKFVQNKMAPTYTTFDLSKYDGDDILGFMRDMGKKYDYVRMKNTPKTHMIKSLELSNTNIHIMVKKEEEEITLSSEWDFILNNEYLLPEEIQKYIEITKNEIIPIETIRNLITA